MSYHPAPAEYYHATPAPAYSCHAIAPAHEDQCGDHRGQHLVLAQYTEPADLVCSTLARTACIDLHTEQIVDEHYCGKCADIAFACPTVLCGLYEEYYAPSPSDAQYYEPVATVTPYEHRYYSEPSDDVYVPQSETDAVYEPESETDAVHYDPAPAHDYYTGAVEPLCTPTGLLNDGLCADNSLAQWTVNEYSAADDATCSIMWEQKCFDITLQKYVDAEKCGGCLPLLMGCGAGSCGEHAVYYAEPSHQPGYKSDETHRPSVYESEQTVYEPESEGTVYKTEADAPTPTDGYVAGGGDDMVIRAEVEESSATSTCVFTALLVAAIATVSA